MLLQFNSLQILQAFFLLAASTTLFLNSVPALRSRYITYGSRAIAVPGTDRSNAQETRVEYCSLQQLLDNLAEIQVPHEYFQHFYIVSVSSSLFWAVQVVGKGSVLQWFCRNAHQDFENAMSVDQIALAWALMSIQGLRRLFESATLTKASTSTMWFVHWLLGCMFYVAVGVGIWIEGTGTLMATQSFIHSITFSAPSLRTVFCIPIFLIASGIQHDCHTYLASLPKYTLPVHPLFQTLICPHYTVECLIYLSLAFLSAPKGAWINTTMFTAFVFVSTNLSITASTSKEWYEKKFGKEKVAGRWKMVPLVW